MTDGWDDDERRPRRSMPRRYREDDRGDRYDDSWDEWDDDADPGARPRGIRDASGREATVQAGRAAAHTTGRLARSFAARVKRAADADGADVSGMSPLLGAQALSSAGDAMIIVALANTVFFDVPLGEARGKVALYLLLTLMPFSLLVPVAGPLLDRFRHGRRAVLAITALARAVCAWQLATSLDSIDLFPLALAVLVLSRAYGVARSAAMPRVKPPGLTMVAANARINFASVISTGLGAAIGGVIARVDGAWTLRLAAVVMVAAAVFSVRLPAHIDEERQARRRKPPAYKILQGPPHVVQPFVAAVALRGLAGYLTIFLAFLLRAQNVSTGTLGAVVGAVVGGQLVGTALASRLPAEATRKLTTAQLILPGIGCLAAAIVGEPMWAAVAAGLTGVSYSVSKFALDASLQSNAPSDSVSGAFSRSETGLQFAFAVGGALAVGTPTKYAVGFAFATLIPIAGTVVGLRAKRGLPVAPPLPLLFPRRKQGYSEGMVAATDPTRSRRENRGSNRAGANRSRRDRDRLDRDADDRGRADRDPDDRARADRDPDDRGRPLPRRFGEPGERPVDRDRPEPTRRLPPRRERATDEDFRSGSRREAPRRSRPVEDEPRDDGRREDEPGRYRPARSDPEDGREWWQD
jgi:hypothetical protein